MILREVRRFVRGSPLISVSGAIVLAIGIGSSTLAAALLLTFSSMRYQGMRGQGYATVAEAAEGGGSMPIAWTQFEHLRSQGSRGGIALAAYHSSIDTTLDLRGVSRPLKVAAVSSGFFSVFTSRLMAGRDFNTAEEAEAGRHAVILAPALAREMFQSAQNAVGRFITINSSPYRVVGVAPRGFHGMFGDSVQAWVPANCVIPLILNPPRNMVPPDSWKGMTAFYGVAAAKDISSAALAASLSRTLPLHKAVATPLHVSQGLTTDPARDAKLRKWLRLGLLLAFIFTIVSSLNYALLLFARTPRQVEETRLKKALGARASRLMMELIAGPAAMALTGLLLAGMIRAGGLIVVARSSAFYGQVLQGSWQAAWPVMTAGVLFATALTVVIALLPVLGLLRDSGTPSTGHTSTADRHSGRWLQVPVTLQIALCIAVCVLGGMIVASLVSVLSESLGYDPGHLAVIAIAPGTGGVSFTSGSGKSFPTATAIDSLIAQIKALPGVRSASFASSAPFDALSTVGIQSMDNSSAVPRTIYEMDATPGYFNTMRTQLIRGRDFSAITLTGHGYEIVLSASLARELWPKQNPVGRSARLIYPAFSGMPSFSQVATVVGVVQDMRMAGYGHSPEPTAFMPLQGFDITPRIIVRGSESLHSIEALADAQVPTLMPGLQVDSVYTLQGKARAILMPEKRRVYFALGGAFLMALLACIGLYGSLAYFVSARRRELAVRICFGASPWAVRKIVIVRAARCAIAGLFLSLPAWLVLARWSSSEYMGQLSWSTGRAAIISLACVGGVLLISLLPAAVASSVSPSEVLKEQ